MQMSAFEQPLRDERDAAGAMQIGGDEAAARLEIGEQRHTRVDAVEVVDVERHAALRCAMASRCSTALVEPPVAATAAMAFSSASRVMI